MTDPVAALAFILEESGLSYEQPPAEDAKRVWDEMVKSGYVLVSADMLAAALHSVHAFSPWEWWAADDRGGGQVVPGYSPEFAAAIFAALKGPAR